MIGRILSPRTINQVYVFLSCSCQATSFLYVRKQVDFLLQALDAGKHLFVAIAQTQEVQAAQEMSRALAAEVTRHGRVYQCVCICYIYIYVYMIKCMSLYTYLNIFHTVGIVQQRSVKYII